MLICIDFPKFLSVKNWALGPAEWAPAANICVLKPQPQPGPAAPWRRMRCGKPVNPMPSQMICLLCGVTTYRWFSHVFSHWNLYRWFSYNILHPDVLVCSCASQPAQNLEDLAPSAPSCSFWWGLQDVARGSSEQDPNGLVMVWSCCWMWFKKTKKMGTFSVNGDINSKIIYKMVPNNTPTVWGRYLPPIDSWGWFAFGLTTLEKTMMDWSTHQTVAPGATAKASNSQMVCMASGAGSLVPG